SRAIEVGPHMHRAIEYHAYSLPWRLKVSSYRHERADSDFGAHLRFIRTALGISQSEIAKQAGIHVQSVRMLVTLADALGIQVGFLSRRYSQNALPFSMAAPDTEAQHRFMIAHQGSKSKPKRKRPTRRKPAIPKPAMLKPEPEPK